MRPIVLLFVLRRWHIADRREQPPVVEPLHPFERGKLDGLNRLRADGLERREALLKAAELRFRPIMMTAFTTICGMVPVTLSGASSIGLSYTSFGLTLIGGLTTATLLTLLVVPVFYTFCDDAQQLVTGRAIRHALGTTPRGERAEA